MSLPTWSLQRRHELRVGVAERVDGDAAERVEVLLALGVPDPAAVGRATARSAGGRRSASRAARRWRRRARAGRSRKACRARSWRLLRGSQGRADSKGASFDTGPLVASQHVVAPARRQSALHPTCRAVAEPSEVFIQGHDARRQDVSPERLGRAAGRRDVVLPARGLGRRHRPPSSATRRTACRAWSTASSA